MILCLFEDSGFEKLFPLVYHRPVYDLISGTGTLGEKIIHNINPDSVVLHSRGYLTTRLRELYEDYSVNVFPDFSGDILFVNGRILADHDFAAQAQDLKPGQKLVMNEQLLAACVSGEESSHAAEKIMKDSIDLDDFSEYHTRNGHAVVCEFLWELIAGNGKQIAEDLEHGIWRGSKLTDPPVGVHVMGQDRIIVGKNVQIFPGTVLDATGGPVILGDNVTIRPNSILEGPLFIGDDTIINGLTRIGNSSIDRMCKLGGEIHSTIMHAFTNKQHDGFLGDAYIGSWVNLGAGTTNSNLKNDYGKIQVMINGRRYDSGSRFIGLLMGDHSKTGIGSLFNTGTVIGPNCNIFGGGLPPQELPGFTWGSPLKRFTTYRLNKALRVARIVMERRGQDLSQGEEEIFRVVYDATMKAREAKAKQ